VSAEVLDGGAVKEVAALCARALAEPHELNDHEAVYSVVVPNDSHRETIDLEALLDSPRRKQGTVLVGDAPSFAAYFADHQQGGTRVYADKKAGTITAVFNDDADDEPGWRDHRLQLKLTKTDPWKRWEAIDGRLMTQESFAEFVEESVLDIEDPDSATMLDLAQHFEATSRADFQSSQLLDNGQRRFVYKETIQAKAGQAGNLDIPKELTLGLAPYEGGDRYAVKALLRFRLGDGGLKMGVRLVRPEVILEKAFADVLQATHETIGVPVLVGTPAEPRRAASITAQRY
jgi:uncharacterized protein YfdQ (DUF2303 family)